MRVIEVTTTGPVSVTSLSPFEYPTLQAKFLAQGIRIPSPDEIHLDTWSNLWLLNDDVTVNVKSENHGNLTWHSFEFFRGLVYDLASVPKIFRGIVDDNDQTVLHAALVHDLCFTTHCLPFEQANAMLQGIARARGASRLKAGIYKAAVSSIFGRIAYNQRTPKRALWQEPFFRYSAAPSAE